MGPNVTFTLLAASPAIFAEVSTTQKRRPPFASALAVTESSISQPENCITASPAVDVRALLSSAAALSMSSAKVNPVDGGGIGGFPVNHSLADFNIRSTTESRIVQPRMTGVITTVKGGYRGASKQRRTRHSRRLAPEMTLENSLADMRVVDPALRCDTFGARERV
jgi:hypothetical protein